jgi:Zn-dependent metalloprotease/surface antigen
MSSHRTLRTPCSTTMVRFACAGLAALGILVVAKSAAFAEPGKANPQAIARAAAIAALGHHLADIHGASGDKYTVYSTTVDPSGAAHVRFTRTYHGLRVYGGDFIIHLARGGAYRGSTVGLTAPLSLSTTPTISPRSAEQVARRHFAGHISAVGAAALVVDALTGHGRLAWETIVSGSAPGGAPSRLHVLTDARTGAYLTSWNDVRSFLATATPKVYPRRIKASPAITGDGNSIYGGAVSIDTTLSGSTYEMIDPSHGDDSACDMANGTNTSACALFTSATNTWGNGSNSDPASAGVDAYYGGAETYDYFNNVQGRNGYSGNGAGIPLLVHYDNDLAGAYSYPTIPLIVFGDGPGNATPYVSLDVVAHEVTHAYTESLVGGGTGLIYEGESGGLDEATSDIFSQMVEFYANNPNEPGNYQIGLLLNPNGNGTPIRYMYDPPLDGHTAGCYNDVNSSSVNPYDWMGVADHFFFDLAEGTGNTSFGDSPVCAGGSPVTGIGRDKAAKIWYTALQNYFTSTTTYSDARVATLQAAADLYGLCSVEYRTVQAAWTAVQVDGNDAACQSYPLAGHADDVLFIHGFTGISSNGSNGTVSGGCAGTWDTAISTFRMMGWTGRLLTVGYYTGDWQSGNSCDIQFDSKSPGTAHVSACDSYYFSAADEGTNNQDLRNLSCQLAWYIYNNYTSHGRNVWVVAHSMGGLMIRDALDEVNDHNPAYPPYLYVPGVVTFGTPNGGIPSPAGAGVICGGCVQASNMQTGAGSPSAFIDHLTAETYAPTGSPGEPTQWTDITSTGEAWYTGIDPASALNFPNSRPGYPAVQKVEYTSTPGTNPDPYNHGGYLTDSSANADATALTCGNCGTPQTSDATSYHSLVLAATALSYTPPAVPGYPVQNQSGGGAFFDGWQNVTGVYGPLQDPASTMVSVATGQEQAFQGTNCAGANAPNGSGSALFWSSATGTHEVLGCIYQAYEQTYGGPAGVLGFPTTGEQAMGSGRVSYFIGQSRPTCSTGSLPSDGVTTAAIYWNPASGSAHDVYGCIFALYHSLGEAAGELGFPVDDAYATNGGHQQDFEHGTIFGSNGSYSVSYHSQWVVGHAAHAGNDYPYETVGQFDHQYQGTDAWNEYYGQCDSFAAWKVYENLAGGAAQVPNVAVPAVNWRPSNASVSPVNQNTWFNADNWDVMARSVGWTVDTIPAPGTIAYWPNAYPDPQDGHATSANGMGEFGHVGYVTDVYPDGSVTIEMYNLRLNGQYSTIHMAFGQSATDTSYNQGAFTVPWPTYFIHAGDGIGSPAPASPEPAAGTVSWGYATQVKVIGPGSPSSEFSLGNVWYSHPGHGEIGQEEWTHTNGATAVSTATWTPSGLAASACYRVDAFVPDNYSDNPVAVYTVSDINGSHMAAVNENVHTNDWAELGVYETNGSGNVTVKLDDRGTTGLYVAADAMRFWRQASCGSYGDVAPIMMPNTTNGTWSTDSGHGFFGDMKYTSTSGQPAATGANAGWVVNSLLPDTCYEISAYVPDNYSDNDAARYEVIDGYYGTFWPQLNENAFTNEFAPMGGFMSSGSDITVALTNMGPAGQYVAADAVAFTPDPLCEGPTGSGLGPVYPQGVIGPGSSPGNFVTANPWYLRLGHGYAYHELWTHDNGSTADSTATWTFAGSPNTCYSVSAYVPDNFADNPQAHYAVGTSAEGVALTMSQQSHTNQFVWLASVSTGSNGVVTVHLSDMGPATDSNGNPLYTAADAMEFVANGAGC